jgi:hypothetical protein
VAEGDEAEGTRVAGSAGEARTVINWTHERIAGLLREDIKVPPITDFVGGRERRKLLEFESRSDRFQRVPVVIRIHFLTDEEASREQVPVLRKRYFWRRLSI